MNIEVIENGDKVEAYFYPDKWVLSTFIGMDKDSYVVRTDDGYKCSERIRKPSKRFQELTLNELREIYEKHVKGEQQ